MEDLSILWVAAVLIAVASLTGCGSTQGMSHLPPIPSPSDTNSFSSGATTSSTSEMSIHHSDNPSMRGTGTTGSTATRK